MKSPTLILTLAIAGASAWSCSKSSTPAADDKSAAAPAPAAASAAAPAPASTAPAMASAAKSPVSVPAMPAASVTPVVAAKPATPAPSGPDPRAEVKTALPEAIRLISAKDYSGFIKEFMPPSAAKASGMTAEQMASMVAMAPQAGESFAKLLPALQAVKDLTPTMDASGNKATYTLNPPIGDIKDLNFVKEDGLWYLGD